MNDQPKPTLEWTPKYIDLITTNWISPKDLHLIANAHNAALAAEQEKREAAEQRAANYHRQILDENEMTKQLLAAEQSKFQLAVAVEALNWLRDELKADDYYVEKIDIAFAKIGVK